MDSQSWLFSTITYVFFSLLSIYPLPTFHENLCNFMKVYALPCLFDLILMPSNTKVLKSYEPIQVIFFTSLGENAKNMFNIESYFGDIFCNNFDLYGKVTFNTYLVCLCLMNSSVV